MYLPRLFRSSAGEFPQHRCHLHHRISCSPAQQVPATCMHRQKKSRRSPVTPLEPTLSRIPPCVARGSVPAIRGASIAAAMPARGTGPIARCCATRRGQGVVLGWRCCPGACPCSGPCSSATIAQVACTCPKQVTLRMCLPLLVKPVWRREGWGEGGLRACEAGGHTSRGDHAMMGRQRFETCS